MRRRAVLGVLAIAVLIYVGLSVWAVVEGFDDAASLTWILFMVPAGIVIAAVLMWKRPSHPIAELLTVGLLGSLMIPTIAEIPTVIVFNQEGAQEWMWFPIWAAQTATVGGVVAISIMLALLPDGKVRHRREATLVRYSWLVGLFPTLALVSNEEVTAHSLAFPGVTGIQSPVTIESLLPYGPGFLAMTALAQSLLLVGAFLQVRRYRKAPLRERRQVRWVLYAGVLSGAVALVPFLLSELGATSPASHTFNMTSILSGLAIIVFPASVAVAVLEPPWIDVDIVIRKSFVYGALSFVILLLYVAVASALGMAAGQRLQIELAVFLTVIVAILFQPARRWLQGLADRWVFGERPTTYAALTEMGQTIDQGADPQELLPRLVETIQKAIRAEWVFAELDDGAGASAGEVIGDPALTVPITSGRNSYGVITCGPALRGSLGLEETKLVETLAGQVGLAISNARLAGRIVTATEEERRRIERNIHDGAQQELVALVARLGMAKSRAAQASLSPSDLEELQDEARRILSELRDLAQGIHPSVLTDGGILEAVEERCSNLPIDVTLEASPSLRSQRFEDRIEGAAYFFVTETLTNVLKHASASHAWVSLDLDGDLTMRVRDDGRGFDPETTTLNGLAGLTDRIQALGGVVRVESHLESGTEVMATLPADR